MYKDYDQLLDSTADHGGEEWEQGWGEEQRTKRGHGGGGGWDREFARRSRVVSYFDEVSRLRTCSSCRCRPCLRLSPSLPILCPFRCWCGLDLRSPPP